MEISHENMKKPDAGLLLMDEKQSTPKYAGELLTLSESIEEIDGENEIFDDAADDDVVDGPIMQNRNVGKSSLSSDFKSFFEQSFSYKMSHPERGCFLIFSQEIYDSRLGLDRRRGANKEAHMLYHTAKHMGYEYIQIFKDCTKSDIFDWLKAVSMASHSVYDSFGCAFLTHSDEDNKLYAKDAAFKLSECTAFFSAQNCPTLTGKPKLFFVQACRDTKSETWFSSKHLNFPFKAVSSKVPDQADILVAFSTTPARRSDSNCSLFVEALYQCFMKYAKTLELMQIMCRVNKMVSFFMDSHESEEGNDCKELPSYTSLLTAEVYLYKIMLERNSQCAMCSSQLESTNPDESSSDLPSTSSSTNKQKVSLKREKSLSKWIRKSLRRKK